MSAAVIGSFLWGVTSATLFPPPWSFVSAIVGGVAIGVLAVAYGAP